MKKNILIFGGAVLVLTAMLLAFSSGQVAQASMAQQVEAPPEACLDCHEGIEDIRQPDTNMYRAIKEAGECTVCHGGDPTVTGEVDDEEAATAAHEGFYPDPGAVWVVEKTCGQTLCHGPEYAYAQMLSLMNTEAGKIKGNMWAYGLEDDYDVHYGNYALDDSDGTAPVFGTESYAAYMQAMIEKFPGQFPASLEAMPDPTAEEIAANPALAALTYQRTDCQRCHLGVPGRSKRGDWRGMGCSACHVPYSNAGLYEGDDPTIPTDEPGRLLTHEIQGDREARGGIPTETCVSCHNRGKRIGVTFQGLMEFPYGTPFNESGSVQDKLHTKRYLNIKDDHHHDAQSREGNPEGGMLCQDCHTGLEMHGDGNIAGTTLAAVEIECSDCHGTPESFPWELPLGYGEEGFIETSVDGRGTAAALQEYQEFGVVYDPEDGYLLTARGNAFGNLVRRGDSAILHSATGRDYTIPLLKGIALAGEWKNLNAEVAMVAIGGGNDATGGPGHMESLECYTCHSDWAPQCYGCHVYTNYAPDKDGNYPSSTDWVAVGNSHAPDGTVDTSLKTPGKTSEGRSYLRWEEPILGVNGEGRVTPLIPGCQVIFSVKGPDGTVYTLNEIGRTAPGIEGGGDQGQRGIDMAPAAPHSTGRVARSCESCHNNPKSLGYGIEGGRFLLGFTEDKIVDLDDLTDPTAPIIPANTKVQIPAIPDLSMDLSQIVNPETGEQLQTVGSHWESSGPLSAEQRERAERIGVCMGCHQNMADTAFWNDSVIEIYGQISANDDHIDAMTALLDDAVAGSVALADLDAALAENQDLQAQLAQAGESTPAEVEETAPLPEAVETAPAPNLTLYVILALVGGLIVGAGAVALAKKK